MIEPVLQNQFCHSQTQYNTGWDLTHNWLYPASPLPNKHCDSTINFKEFQQYLIQKKAGFQVLNTLLMFYIFLYLYFFVLMFSPVFVRQMT